MSRESLTIRNFGPIVNVELPDIKRFNIFIGESGSGKSTIMKVLAMMRWIYKMCCVRTYFKTSGIQTPFRFRTEAILTDNGLKDFLRHNSEITYQNGSFVIQLIKGGLKFPRKNVDQQELTLQKISYISDKRVLIPDLAAGNVSLRHGMFYLDETFLNFRKALDVIPESAMDYLGVKMTVRKNNVGKRVFVSSLEKDINPFDNLPLTSASSGMQSSVALHFIIKYFSRHYDIVDSMNSTIVRFLAAGDNLSKFSAASNIGSFPHKRTSIHLEEPELSLFPVNQWGLMKFLIGECLLSEKSEMDLSIATHSPYILTAINIMMLANRASKTDKSAFESLSIDIPLLDVTETSAWSVRDGKCESLLDSTTGLIDGTYLDNTSDIYEDLIINLNNIIYG
ncbi:MAG: ATP-binding protein [Muribaculaceae bacterium]|nr:ATP-binding protein [Muribaculaceae bacterium]